MGVPWARPSRPFDLTGYRRFTLAPPDIDLDA